VLVVVSQAGARPEARVVLQQEGGGGTGTTTETETAKQPPNPILPVGKEMAWAFGTFLALFLVMRYVLYPRLKRGMDARYQFIRGQLEKADAVRAAAEGEAAQYQAAVAEVRAQAASRIDAARQELESVRQQRLTEVNAEIGEQRAAAADAAEEARRAALGQVELAVGDVAASVAERALGAPVDRTVAEAAAAEVVRAGVGS
jgi:F-type H+-transporting ATPase subunit b